MNKFEEVSPAEWQVLRIIWTLDKATSSDIISYLGKKNNWNDSTVKTLIGRLVKKEILEVDKKNRPFIYTAKYSEDYGIESSVEILFNNICDMEKSNAIGDLIDNSPISKSELEVLIQKLEKKRVDAPERVECNCLRKEDYINE
ncbi:CopY/TcrY family copper transport repressor [Companilactobacillus sp. DQM5]|uniref:CopY/TcrY family copper transport repressor n=1 Tax=Companilactobacillus sp. DQM5 TaxID=3463359 RepID=UPI00405987C7